MALGRCILKLFRVVFRIILAPVYMVMVHVYTPFTIPCVFPTLQRGHFVRGFLGSYKIVRRLVWYTGMRTTTLVSDVSMTRHFQNLKKQPRKIRLWRRSTMFDVVMFKTSKLYSVWCNIVCYMSRPLHNVETAFF
jgi:hypothetical protein